jgi:hypothetical protein
MAVAFGGWVDTSFSFHGLGAWDMRETPEFGRDDEA